jgi:ParB-like chromosome segregation protein Spo0J
MKKQKVHPVAELFPMMSDEELDDLAADIKANGQQQPIVRDENGLLIDGRNREEACRRAGVEPKYITLDGQDPIVLIFSSNIRRRNLTKGQSAMIVARARVLLKISKSQTVIAKEVGVAQQYVGQAAIVLEYAPELADAIVAGSLSLNEAYKTAQDRKAAANSKEAQMEKLKTDAPDLADLVTEERMPLSEALAALRERKAKEQEHRQVTTRLFAQAVTLFDPQSNETDDLAQHLIDSIDPKLTTTDLSKDHLKAALEVFKTIVTRLKP